MATILLVEDSPDIRLVVEMILHAVGHTVVSAHDGASALDMAAQQQPDLIVMDLALPKLNGWEATRRLKADPLTRHIPVLACTAHLWSDEIEQALDAGCEVVIPKPFDISTLLTHVDQWLPPGPHYPRERAVGMPPKG